MQGHRAGPTAVSFLEEVKIIAPETGHGGRLSLVPVEGDLRPGLFHGQELVFQGGGDQGEPQIVFLLGGPDITLIGAVQGPVIIIGVPDFLVLERG